MRRALQRVVHSMLALFMMAAVGGCFEIDLTGLDMGTGTGCYLCYPETFVPDIPYEPAPVAVVGGLRFSALSVGVGHVCGVSTDATVHCWGERLPGSLPFGSTLVPEAIPETGGFTRVAAGHAFTCAMRADDRALCWGRNAAGELGTGQRDVPASTPTAVLGGLTFTSISTSGAASDMPPHTCGLTPDGAAYCWGNNTWGALGNGTLASSAVPVPVAGGHVFESITVGAEFTCGIVRRAGAYCWGMAGDGRLGDDSRSANCMDGSGFIPCSTRPAPVTNGQRFAAISAGRHHACALDAEGIAYCWGANPAGQLGDETLTWSFVPRRISGSLRFTSISAGVSGTCGLTTGQQAFCWGANALGEVGDGTTAPRLAPAAVATDIRFATIDAGQNHVCALTPEGAAYCWGSNYQGKLGKGS